MIQFFSLWNKNVKKNKKVYIGENNSWNFFINSYFKLKVKQNEIIGNMAFFIISHITREVPVANEQIMCVELSVTNNIFNIDFKVWQKGLFLYSDTVFFCLSRRIFMFSLSFVIQINTHLFSFLWSSFKYFWITVLIKFNFFTKK